MTDARTKIRALLVYALILPIAAWIGASLTDVTANPLSRILLGFILLLLCLPLLLKWHHPILFLTWNMTVVLAILPGGPQLWFVMAFSSLLITAVQRALLADMRILHVNSLFWPITFLIAVVLFTALSTQGGFGMRVLGGGSFGGKRYLMIIAAVVGYFAMIARPIPPNRAMLYVGLFFLGSLVNAVSNMLPYVSSYGPKLAWFLSRFFPVTEQDFGSASAVGFDQYVSRFLGLTLACQFTFCYLLARWGLREIFSFHKPWRLFLLVGVGLLGALGGFRSYMALAGLAFLFVFYLEGLVRSRYMIGLCAAVLIGGALLIPFSDKLPLSIQRSISFLPVEIDPVARFDAENSSRWRFELWGAVWPEVHRYFWRGRGLSLEARDYEAATLEGDMVRRPSFLYATEVATGDFHSGPLTVIVPFGIWGVLAWLWFLGAGIRATYLNYRHGDSALSKVNTFLFAYFLTRTVVFFLVFGNLYSDIPLFTGLLGLSMAINGGIREPAPAPARETPRYAAFQRPVPRAGTLKVSETAGSHCPG